MHVWHSNRVFVLVAALLALAPATGGAQEAADRARRHLEAGELGLARAAAHEVADERERNELLAGLAHTQMLRGATAGAWRSLSEISDDRYRTDALDRMAAEPMGGAALADFDTLIELITATVAPDAWDEAGGPGAIQEFPTGVLVDADGVLRKIQTERGSLESLRRHSLASSANQDARKTSKLRKVSLTRLEREIQLAWQAGREPDEAMRYLAGMYRVEYVFVYPQTGDLVIAGPAGDWAHTDSGNVTNRETSAPVLRLDDLVVLLRHARHEAGPFGCAIKPRQENLERAQKFLNESAERKLKPGQRNVWLRQLEEALGRQDIEVFGIDPQTRVAKILVEADYQMKLVGIGRDEATLGLTTYMDLAAENDAGLDELSVLRWWFAMNYDAVRATHGHDGFQLTGPAVKLLSENELLTERGERIHTGRSDEKNSMYAASFTKHYSAMAAKYPVFAELRNVFDLALVAALIQHQGLADQVDWHMTHFGDPNRFSIARFTAPVEVDSVVNHRTTGPGKFIAAAAGGVHADAQAWVAADRLKADEKQWIEYTRGYAAAAESQDVRRWWWD